ncbi:Rrf2 family transcriptional regulator [Candidatus Parcubacteria bacterium]|nr:MAG: Rrf2 family transcriptional regulator [Candidatus Parcubacteria bacterium]
MLKFTTKAEYSLRAMAILAKNYKKTAVSLAKIAREEKISKVYLEQLFSKLKKNHLVTANKGVNGGYILLRSPENVSAADIIEATEGSLEPFYCVSPKGNCCAKKGCLTRKMWIKVHQGIKITLENTKLSDLIK